MCEGASEEPLEPLGKNPMQSLTPRLRWRASQARFDLERQREALQRTAAALDSKLCTEAAGRQEAQAQVKHRVLFVNPVWCLIAAATAGRWLECKVAVLPGSGRISACRDEGYLTMQQGAIHQVGLRG